jgi:hypothetical protein
MPLSLLLHWHRPLSACSIGKVVRKMTRGYKIATRERIILFRYREEVHSRVHNSADMTPQEPRATI